MIIKTVGILKGYLNILFLKLIDLLVGEQSELGLSNKFDKSARRLVAHG